MFDKYCIQKGDSLKSIAEKFDTTVDNIKDINNIVYPDLLRAGIDIVVPKSKDEHLNYHKIEQGDTLYNIAKNYNINPELLALLNGLELSDYIYQEQEILIPKNGYSYYMTKAGDALKDIADKFGGDIDHVLKENKNIYLLEGQLLVHKR